MDENYVQNITRRLLLGMILKKYSMGNKILFAKSHECSFFYIPNKF